MDELNKQPAERFDIEVDFTDVLKAAETIDVATSTATATDRFGTADASVIDAATLAVVNVSSLQVRVQAGSAALSPYKLTLRCSTNTGSLWEKDIQMTVREI